MEVMASAKRRALCVSAEVTADGQGRSPPAVRHWPTSAQQDWSARDGVEDHSGADGLGQRHLFRVHHQI